MITERSAVFLFGMMFLVSCCSSSKSSPAASPPAPQLSQAAPSLDVLVDKLLLAVTANDMAALSQLRVSESEYRTLIAPGTVEEGQPWRHLDEKSTRFFWQLLDSKSQDFTRQLLADYAGKQLARKEIRLTKGVHKFAAYTAHGQVRVLVTDSDGSESVVRSGTVAQVGDQYKFIGLNWDD